MNTEPNTQEAISFLSQFHADRAWTLHAVSPEKRGFETATFGPDNRAAAEKWLNARNGKKNIYFNVNVSRVEGKKGLKEDVAAMVAIHADLDAAATDNLTQAKEEMLGQIREYPKQPTWIIDSGGGYWVFFTLKNPMETAGEVEIIEDYERYNIGLQEAFGDGDDCHNLDRIARLPGTVNIPDQKKIAKGRQRITSSVIEHNPNALYDFNDFTKGELRTHTGKPTSGVANAQTGRTERITVDMSKVSVATIDDLGDEVQDWCKIVIEQGEHPDNEKYQYGGDRSRALFAVCCEMARGGTDPETMAGIITNPAYRISDSVLKRKDLQRYVRRQVDRALDFIDDPWLVDMNREYAIIANYGGKFRVMQDLYEYGVEYDYITFLSIGDFKNGLAHRKIPVVIDGEEKLVPISELFLQHRRARRYKTVGFHPRKDLHKQVLNLWDGFAFDPKEGDCEILLDHIRRNICKGNEQHFQYLMGWMARTVQKPWLKGEVAVVLRGLKGTGKTFISDAFGTLFGRHYKVISSAKHLVGNFNNHLRDCVVLFADEAFFAGDKQGEGVLKTLITDSKALYESKGVDARQDRNFTHVIMSSNSDWVVPASADERRYFVLDVGEEHRKDSAYFAPIANWLENEDGYAKFLNLLDTWDISDFNVRDVPQTEALKDQKRLSLSPFEQWWFERLCDGNITTDYDGWPEKVPTDILHIDYLTYCDRMRYQYRDTKNTLSKKLMRLNPGMINLPPFKWKVKEYDERDGMGVVKSKSKRGKSLPDLATCRSNWDEVYGSQPWDAVPDQYELQSERFDDEDPF